MAENIRRYIHLTPQRFKVVGFVGYNPESQKQQLDLTLNVSKHNSLDISNFLNKMVKAVV